MTGGVACRVATDADAAWMRDLYFRSRTPEFAVVGLRDDALTTLLGQQFEAQRQAMAGEFPHADHFVITRDDAPVGRLVLAENDAAIHVADILVDVSQRGAGVGTAALREVLNRADATARAVTLRVDPHNPARRLYERLGFVLVDASDATSHAYRRGAQAKTAS